MHRQTRLVRCGLQQLNSVCWWGWRQARLKRGMQLLQFHAKVTQVHWRKASALRRLLCTRKARALKSVALHAWARACAGLRMSSVLQELAPSQQVRHRPRFECICKSLICKSLIYMICQFIYRLGEYL